MRETLERSKIVTMYSSPFGIFFGPQAAAQLKMDLPFKTISGLGTYWGPRLIQKAELIST